MQYLVCDAIFCITIFYNIQAQNMQHSFKSILRLYCNWVLNFAKNMQLKYYLQTSKTSSNYITDILQSYNIWVLLSRYRSWMQVILMLISVWNCKQDSIFFTEKVKMPGLILPQGHLELLLASMLKRFLPPRTWSL